MQTCITEFQSIIEGSIETDWISLDLHVGKTHNAINISKQIWPVTSNLEVQNNRPG